MKNKQNDSNLTNNLNSKIIDLSLLHLKGMTDLSIKHLENKYSFLEFQRNNLLDDEPLKFFKKKHNEWRIKLENIENDLHDTLLAIESELDDLSKIDNAVNN